jgi:hypothetical protein
MEIGKIIRDIMPRNTYPDSGLMFAAWYRLEKIYEGGRFNYWLYFRRDIPLGGEDGA